MSARESSRPMRKARERVTSYREMSGHTRKRRTQSQDAEHKPTPQVRAISSRRKRVAQTLSPTESAALPMQSEAEVEAEAQTEPEPAPLPDTSVLVHIKEFLGEHITSVRLQPDESIGALKRALHESEPQRVPSPSRQTLLQYGRVLDNARTFAEQRIGTDNTLMLLAALQTASTSKRFPRMTL